MPLLLVQLSVNLTAYSQTTILNKSGDTLICFTVDQAKFLLKQVYEVRKYQEIDSIHRAQHAICDSLNQSCQKIILDQGEIIVNQSEIVKLREYEIKKLNEQLETERKATRKQRRQKYLAIGIGSAGTLFMTYLWLMK